MVDLQILKDRGISYEDLKTKLKDAHRYSLKADSADKKDTDEFKRASFIQRIISRVEAGRNFNSAHYKLYQALDMAYDIEFNQLTPTLLSSLVDKTADDKTVLSTLKSWGYDPEEVLVEVPDPKTPGKNIKKVSVPAFFRIFVPLVGCYVKIRWAKIMNERKLVPFLKYEPAISTEQTRLRCDVITARVESMSRTFGYYDVEKQSVFRMLHYGECLRFPMEEWYQEFQEVKKSEDIEGEPIKGRDTLKVLVKEGIRYHFPHPTRTYYDRTYMQHTINSDTGCKYAGYWRVTTWGEVRNNPKFYNLDSVGFSTSATWSSRNEAFLRNTIGCAMSFPIISAAQDGTGKTDQETSMATNNCYSAALDDKAVLITEHFEKVIPKDVGFGDYEYPVWFRVVLAGDGAVIYCAPLPYNPEIYYGYDFAEGRTHPASMSLEVLPFQDQFSNLLTQYLLTVRQNLSNLSMVDVNAVDEADIKSLENSGERFWRVLNFLRFDSRKLEKAKIRPDAAFIQHKFAPQDTNSLINAMKVILDTLERILVMSSLEVGQAGTHEQTAEEISNITQNTSTRVVFTTTAVDIARDAWKKQLYQGLMAYGQDEFYAQVPMENKIDAKALEKLGFTYSSEDGSFDPVEKKAELKVKKVAIAYESFASERDGNDRINNMNLAKELLGFMEMIMGNQMLAEGIGPVQLVQMLNYILKLAGLPRDFKFKLDPSKVVTPEFMQQMQQMIQQVSQSIMQDVSGAIKQLADVNNQQTSQIDDLGQSQKLLAQRVAEIQTMAAAPGPGSMPPMPPPGPMGGPPMMPPQIPRPDFAGPVPA